MATPSSNYKLGSAKISVDQLAALVEGVMQNQSTKSFLRASGLPVQRPLVDISNASYQALLEGLKTHGYSPEAPPIRIILAPLPLRSQLHSINLPTPSLHPIDQLQINIFNSFLNAPSNNVSVGDCSNVELEMNFNRVLSSCWGKESLIDWSRVENKIGSNIFLIPDGQHRIRALLEVRDSIILDIRSDLAFSVTTRAEEVEIFKKEFRINIEVYGSGAVIDRTVYSAFSTVNKFALSVQDDRFIFESNIADVLASRLSTNVEPLVLKKSEPFHHLIYQSGLRALVESTTSSHYLGIMLNKHIGSYKSPHSILGHESHLFEIAPSYVLQALADQQQEDEFLFGPTSPLQTGLFSLLNRNNKNLTRILHLDGVFCHPSTNSTTSFITSITPTHLTTFITSASIFSSIISETIDELRGVAHSSPGITKINMDKLVNKVESDKNSVSFIGGNWKSQQTGAQSKLDETNRISSFVSKTDRVLATQGFIDLLCSAKIKVEGLIDDAKEGKEELKVLLARFNGSTSRIITIDSLLHVKSIGNTPSASRLNFTTDILLLKKMVLTPFSSALLLFAPTDLPSNVHEGDPRRRTFWSSLPTSNLIASYHFSHSLLAYNERHTFYLSDLFDGKDLSIGSHLLKKKQTPINIGSSTILSTTHPPQLPTVFSIGTFTGIRRFCDSAGNLIQLQGDASMTIMLEFEKAVVAAMLDHIVVVVIVAITANAFQQLLPPNSAIPKTYLEPTNNTTKSKNSIEDPLPAVFYPLPNTPTTSNLHHRSNFLHYKEVQSLLTRLTIITPTSTPNIPLFTSIPSVSLPPSIEALRLECNTSLLTSSYAFNKDIEKNIQIIVAKIIEDEKKLIESQEQEDNLIVDMEMDSEEDDELDGDGDITLDLQEKEVAPIVSSPLNFASESIKTIPAPSNVAKRSITSIVGTDIELIQPNLIRQKLNQDQTKEKLVQEKMDEVVKEVAVIIESDAQIEKEVVIAKGGSRKKPKSSSNSKSGRVTRSRISQVAEVIVKDLGEVTEENVTDEVVDEDVVEEEVVGKEAEEVQDVDEAIVDGKEGRGTSKGKGRTRKGRVIKYQDKSEESEALESEIEDVSEAATSREGEVEVVVPSTKKRKAKPKSSIQQGFISNPAPSPIPSSVKNETTAANQNAHSTALSTSAQFYARYSKDAFSHLVAWKEGIESKNSVVTLIVFEYTSEMELFLERLGHGAVLEEQAKIIKSYWIYTSQIPVIAITFAESEMEKEEKLSIYKSLCQVWENETQKKANFAIHFDFLLPLLPDLITTSADDEIIIRDNSTDYLALILYHYIHMFDLPVDPRRISQLLLSLEDFLLMKTLPQLRLPIYTLKEDEPLEATGMEDRIAAVAAVLKRRNDWEFRRFLFHPIPTWKGAEVTSGGESLREIGDE